MKGLFVTGTDTAVGKTTVARGLLALARRNGFRLVPFKPAETGVGPDAASDAELLWQAAGRPVPAAEVGLYRFAPPLAPAVAAAASGIVISLLGIFERARALEAAGDALLVEGAGGLLVPYAPGVTGAEIAACLGLKVLVVARAALGTINHTALTLAELRRRRLPLAGVLLVEGAGGPGADAASNAAQIAAVSGDTPIGTLPYLGKPRPPAEDWSSPSDDEIADALAPVLRAGASDPFLRRLCPSG